MLFCTLMDNIMHLNYFVHSCIKYFLGEFKMGRAAKFNHEIAIEISMNEIWRYGFEACSVKALSEKIGITRSSFYNAFGSREALFLEVLDLYFTRSPDRVLSNANDTMNVRQLLTDFLKDVCRTRATDPEARGCLAVNCVAELVGVKEELGSILKNAVLSSVDRFESILKRAALRGEIIDDGRLREKALSLQNLIIGLNVMSKVVRSEKELFSVAKNTLKGLDLCNE